VERYERYKDSGVEWIGEIPVGWEVKKLKYVLSDRLKYGANESALFDNRDDPRYIRITDFGNDGKLRKDTYKSLPFKTAEEYLLQNGDILFARSGATVGKTFQFKNYNGMACFAGYLIKATPNQNIIASDYLYLFTKSSLYERWKESIFNQATIQNIGADKYAYLDVPLPSIQEQTTIADYLDRKTAEIDELIAQKERLIELYEEEKTAIINQAVTKGIDPDARLQDSGIDWLGKIPEGWEIKRLKHLTKTISKGTTPSTIGKEINIDGEIRFIKAENIYNNAVTSEPENYIDDATNNLLERSQLEENDILFVIAGATIGKVAILNKHFLPANTNQAVSFIRLCNKENVNFIWYWLQSSTINELLWLDAVQSAQPNLSMENLGNFVVPFPSSDDQTTIVHHIETEIVSINAKITKTKRIIELQKEYRTALISEVVTGKIKVPEETMP